jgi:hypothetical protein
MTELEAAAHEKATPAACDYASSPDDDTNGIVELSLYSTQSPLFLTQQLAFPLTLLDSQKVQQSSALMPVESLACSFPPSHLRSESNPCDITV